MNLRHFAAILLLCGLKGFAQDPVGAIEGSISDASKAMIAGHVAARNLDTGLVRQTDAGTNGLFRLPLLPVGRYRVTVSLMVSWAIQPPSRCVPQARSS